MPTRLDVVLDDAALRDMKAALIESPRQFYSTVNTVLLPQLQQIVEARLNRDPGPVSDDFDFATDKSRRWYFANRQPPYQRTGDVRQWKLVLKAFTGQTVELSLDNPMPYAKWVYGDPKGEHQVPGHRNTGYMNVANEVPKLTQQVLGDLSEAWIQQLDERKL